MRNIFTISHCFVSVVTKFFAEIFSVPGDDDAAHPTEPPQQGAPQRVPGPQHRVQDAKPEGEGEFTEEIRQEVGPQRPRVLPGGGPGSHCISAAPRDHHHGSLLARSVVSLSHRETISNITELLLLTSPV